MTDLRQAAQQALEALERYQVKRQDFDRFADEITALRTALEQQAEPVAWMDKHGNIDHGLDAILEPEGWKPLYTTPPQQQAEPICPECKAAVLYECVACSSNNYPPQQQAEPVSMRMPKVGDKVICLEDESLGEVVSLTAGGSPDIKFDDGSRGTYLLREFAELFSYVAPPQRQWVGLTDDEIAELYMSNTDRPMQAYWEFTRAIEAKLKERNSENSNQ